MKRSYYFVILALSLKLAFSCGSESLETRGSVGAGTQSNADNCKKATKLSLADPVNYEGQLKAFVDVSCASAGCHSGNNPSRNIQLGNYAGLKLNIAKSIVEIDANRMPSNNSGKPKLNATQVLMLKEWSTTNFTEKPSVAPAATPTPKPGTASSGPADTTATAGQSTDPQSSKTGSTSKTSKNSADCI